MVAGETSGPGAMPQELAIDSKRFIQELSRRDIVITESLQEI